MKNKREKAFGKLWEWASWNFSTPAEVKRMLSKEGRVVNEPGHKAFRMMKEMQQIVDNRIHSYQLVIRLEHYITPYVAPTEEQLERFNDEQK